MINLRKILGSATVAILAAGAITISSPTAASAANGCVPVAMMAMRGSSENSIGTTTYSPNSVSNGFEGAIVTRLLWGLTWHYGSDPVLKDVPIVGLTTDDGYRADALDSGGFSAATKPGSQFWSSAVSGGAAAINRMDSFQAEQPANCAPTKWILIGYSQGAMVARWAYAEAADRVASLYVMGDPFQMANKPGNTGNGSAGTGVVSAMFTGDYSPLSKYYANRPGNSVSMCVSGDIICDNTTPGTNWLAHITYLLNPFDAAGAAVPLKDMILAARAQASGAYTQAPVASVSVNVSVDGMPALVSAGASKIAGTPTYDYDLDGNGTRDAASDGLLLLRTLFGLTGNAVTDNALGAEPRTRNDWAAIRSYLNATCGLALP